MLPSKSMVVTTTKCVCSCSSIIQYAMLVIARIHNASWSRWHCPSAILLNTYVIGKSCYDWIRSIGLLYVLI